VTIPNTWGLAGYCTRGRFGWPGAVSRAHHAALQVLGRREDAKAGAAYLADISGPVTTALRRNQARTFSVRSAQNRPSRGPVMLVLSRHLDVLAQTAED
jgi:hypothetical protein